jgi:small ligand-binding sensory domain FIST
VIGFDLERGVLAASAPVAVGTRLRFALRDGATARAGLREMLEGVKGRLTGRKPKLALWFASAGRGRALFGVPDHDAAFLADLLGDVPLVGLLGGSEIAPTRRGEARLHVFSGVLVLA